MNKGKNRTSMDVQHQIKLLYERGYSLHKISKCLCISRNTVRKFAREQKALKAQALLALEAKTEEITEESIEEKSPLEKEKSSEVTLPAWLSLSDFEWIKAERQKGIQFKTLFEELSPPVTYWTFWRRASALLGQKTPQISVRLEHKPGERAQVDFTDGISIWDPLTGAEKKTQLFVGVLPFSQLTFAVFKESRKLPDFIEAFEAMWAFFGGVTPYVVPDNLKSAVTKAHNYDPDRNKTFL
jgi:transposase